ASTRGTKSAQAQFTSFRCYLVLTGCQSTDGAGNWNRTKTILSCGAGAVIGGIVGAAVAGGRGAALGAAGRLGVGCAVALGLNELDKRRIREAQKRAFEDQAPVSESWVSEKDGAPRIRKVSYEEAPPLETKNRKLLCRRTQGTI